MNDVQPDSPEIQPLLQRARAGDRQAIAELLVAYRAYLCQFVELRLDPKLRARVDPSDIVQEAQMEAVRRLEDYLTQPPMPFRLWLRQLALDRLLMVHRQHVATARRALGREILPSLSAARLLPVPFTGATIGLLRSGSIPSKAATWERSAES